MSNYSIKIALFKFFIVLLTSLCALSVFITLLGDLSYGGNSWRQGDWLINIHREIIRRGVLGSLIIFISDRSSLSPVTITIVLQFAILISLCVCTISAFWQVSDRLCYLLILTSPGFFILFWISNPAGALRKESLSFTAMSLLLLAPIFKKCSHFIILISCAIICIAFIAHEANIFLLPNYMILYFIVAHKHAVYSFNAKATGAILAIATLSLAYAIVFSKVEDANSICHTLIIRGVNPDICQGSIIWLEKNAEYVTSLFTDRFTIFDTSIFILYYGLISAPFIYFILIHKESTKLFVLYFISGVALVPLYILGVDWGRWLSMHIVSFSFISIALFITGNAALKRRPGVFSISCLVLLNLVWAPHYVRGIIEGGAAKHVAKLIGRIFFNFVP